MYSKDSFVFFFQNIPVIHGITIHGISSKAFNAIKTFRLRLRGSRRHNWICRRLTSRAWTSSGPLECTLRALFNAVAPCDLHACRRIGASASCERASERVAAAQSAAVTWPVYTCHSYRITRHYLSNLQRVAPLRYLRFNKLRIGAPAPTLMAFGATVKTCNVQRQFSS